MRSLVLIGHGSHLHSESAGAVHHYAELLRAQGLFGEVVEGYWKEEPSLRQVLKTVQFSDVTIIPMFISEGYFTETVLPRELGLGHQGPIPEQGVTRVIGGRTVHYTRPYGVHEAMQEVILARAQESGAEFGPDTALLVLGHGTTQNSNSREVVVQNAQRLAASGLFGQVLPFFLDEEPSVDHWREQVTARRVVMVPFFASEGWHTQDTIPAQLGLTGEQTQFAGQTVYYTKPVGTHPMVAQVISRLAADARGLTPQGGDLDRSYQAAWSALLGCAEQGPLRLGELLISPQAGLFDLRHALDEGRGNESLTTYVTLSGLWERARYDDAGQYRPLHTLRTLPRGWRAVLSAPDLPRALQYLYPAVVEETFAHHNHALRSTPWAATARRQTGIYAKVARATPAQVEEAARTLCSGCLKTRIWAAQPLHHTFFAGAPGGIPCAEACTLLVANVREQLRKDA